MEPEPNQITQLLRSWSQGDSRALERLMPLVYKELHRIAQRYMLVIAYTMLKNSRSYQDLGGNYLEQINKEQLQHYLVKRLQKLGLTVSVQPATAPA